MKLLPIHPWCELLPPLTAEQFYHLTQDIAVNGLQVPILIHEGFVIDGRHRQEACAKLGVRPIYKKWEGAGEIVDVIWSLNAARRQMTASQKAAAAANLYEPLASAGRFRSQLNLRRGDRRGRRATEQGRATGALARMMGVSERYVAAASALKRKHGEIFSSVLRGEISISKAITKSKRAEKAKRLSLLPPHLVVLISCSTDGSIRRIRVNNIDASAVVQLLLLADSLPAGHVDSLLKQLENSKGVLP
jgi:hypothetical protein